MFNYLVGLFSGIGACILILVIELRLASKGTSILKTIERPVEAKFRPKGAVIAPPDELTQAREDILKENQRKGQDTPLEDLL